MAQNTLQLMEAENLTSVEDAITKQVYFAVMNQMKNYKLSSTMLEDYIVAKVQEQLNELSTLIGNNATSITNHINNNTAHVSGADRAKWDAGGGGGGGESGWVGPIPPAATLVLNTLSSPSPGGVVEDNPLNPGNQMVSYSWDDVMLDGIQLVVINKVNNDWQPINLKDVTSVKGPRWFFVFTNSNGTALMINGQYPAYSNMSADKKYIFMLGFNYLNVVEQAGGMVVPIS